ncbi:MAG TPA: WGR domain-containing protein [Kofleriaceae bacterium]
MPRHDKLVAEKLAGGVATKGGRFITSGKFWEVWIDKTTVYTRFGKTGANGQTKLKALATKAAAEAELERMVAEKRKQGFAEAAGAGDDAAEPSDGSVRDARNPALEKAIEDDPENPESYLVFADWLQSQGDPRGELMALHLADKTKAADKLIEKQAGYFLGPLAEHRQCYDNSGRDAFTWLNGYIHGVRLAHDHYGLPYQDGGKFKDKEISLAAILEELLRHPSGRYLVSVVMNYNNDPNESTLDDLIAVLAKRAPKTIRKIQIGDDVDQISWYNVGNLGKLWRVVPRLRLFSIHAGSFTLGTIELPELVRAVFETGGLSKASAKSIAIAKWPKIEHLDVWFGDDNYGGDASVKDIQPLLDRTDLKKLRHLGLRNAEFTDKLLEVLPKAKILKQLTTLDLSMGVLTDEGAKLLVKHADAYRHLAELNVSDTYLSKDAVKTLKGVAKKIVADDLREDDDPEWRYPAVGE